MNVYIVYDGQYEDRYIVDVYASLEDAKNSHEHKHDWQQYDDMWDCQHVTNHKTGNVPIDQPISFETLEIPVVDGFATLPNGNVVQVEEGTRLIVPVPPKDMQWIREWTTGCDYEIRAYAVREPVTT